MLAEVNAVTYAGGILGISQTRGVHRDLEFSGSLTAVKTPGGSSTPVYIGGITGYCFSSSSVTRHNYSNLRVTGQINVPAEFTSNSGVYLGGLMGATDDVNISDSWVRGDVRSDKTGVGVLYIGGLIGYSTYTNMDNCRYEQGSVTSYGRGQLYLGGAIVSIVNDTSLTNSYSRATLVGGSTSSTISAGGFVGYLQNGNINGCYSTAEVQASSSESTVYAGGLVGQWSSTSTAVVNQNTYTISECYATGNVSAFYTGNGVGSIMAGGLTGADADGNDIIADVVSPFAAWDTNVVSRGFPRLRNVGGQ